MREGGRVCERGRGEGVRGREGEEVRGKRVKGGERKR